MSDMFIVAGVDESWRRTGALEWALGEASTRNIPLHVLHVIRGLARHPRYQNESPYESESADESLRLEEEAAAKLLSEAAGHVVATDQDLEFTTDILVGPPARRLAELSTFAQMVVVGRHGSGLTGMPVSGSTSDTVAANGEGNIVVVPDEWHPELHRTAPVVVGVDGRPESEAALDFAFDSARIHRVPLHMVHVSDPHSEVPADGLLAELAERWQAKYPTVRVVRDARQAHRVLGLLDAAAETEAQLLVTGGRRHSQLTNLPLGSVARRVLQHAGCPVAVIHTR